MKGGTRLMNKTNRPSKRKGKVTQFPQQKNKGNGKPPPETPQANATETGKEQLPYLLPAQARNELITYLDSLLLSGKDSIGRHSAITFLSKLQQIKVPDKK